MDFSPASTLINLHCPVCGDSFDASLPQTTCPNCQSPVLARYDLPAVKKTINRDQLSSRPRGLWRWAELLPVRGEEHRLTLGEGDTPLLPLPRLAKKYGLSDLMVKEEALNPTGSYQARGMCVAVSKARELGLTRLVIAAAGNNGGALAAYAARGGMVAHVFMPDHSPLAFQRDVIAFHGDLRLVNEPEAFTCAEALRQGWFDVSAFKEPYRVEGMKTIGFELAEQLSWQLPDVIICPIGGGTGLVGIWKAFSELEALGWIGPRRPRLVNVQAAGCAPAPFSERLILQALRESSGTAVTVTEEEIQAAQTDFATQEGMINAPEGASTLAALKRLIDSKFIGTSDRVVLVNSGSGLQTIDSQGGNA